MPRLCGGHSSLRAPTQDELDFLTSTTVITNLLAPKLLSSSSSSSSMLSTSSTALPIVPIAMTTQVVAGTVYQVKYKWTIDSDNSNNDNNNDNNNNIDQNKMIRYCHAKIYKPLPCNPEKDVALMSFQDDCTVEAPFNF
mmetsp:Transcript_35778/g.40896  ORF Transcript_35778/g.40896 Transcript_35778/m.40896 type:complete len:139 (+) Transcript_35778:81-497(+)